MFLYGFMVLKMYFCPGVFLPLSESMPLGSIPLCELYYCRVLLFGSPSVNVSVISSAGWVEKVILLIKSNVFLK